MKIHRIGYMKPVIELSRVCLNEINTKRPKEEQIRVHGSTTPNKVGLKMIRQKLRLAVKLEFRKTELSNT